MHQSGQGSNGDYCVFMPIWASVAHCKVSIKWCFRPVNVPRERGHFFKGVYKVCNGGSLSMSFRVLSYQIEILKSSKSIVDGILHVWAGFWLIETRLCIQLWSSMRLKHVWCGNLKPLEHIRIRILVIGHTRTGGVSLVTRSQRKCDVTKIQKNWEMLV